MQDTGKITGWHAHVYFDPDEIDRARAVCEAARARFSITMGRMHERPVGPHPTGSCQLSVPPDRFAEVVSWLTLNRDGLDVFTHAETGDAWADHTRHVLWLGQARSLRLDVLRTALDND